MTVYRRLVRAGAGARDHAGAGRRRHAELAVRAHRAFCHGSTTYVREGFGTFASRSMVVGGSAVMDGCNNLIAAIRAAATQRSAFPMRRS